MKKSLIALAVAGAFSGSAFAQSTVTLFGIVDTGFGYFKGDGNGNQKVMRNSGLNSSRFGMRGSEDLGGGLKANFWAEWGSNTDDGSGQGTNTNNQASGNGPAAGGGQGFTFNRRMFVGLSGGFGEFRLGRDYTPIFLQITSNDPFGTNGSGDTKIYATTGLSTTAAVQTTVRTSNQFEYLTPSGIGGVYVHAQYALGENASNSGTATVGTNDGRSFGVRVGWAGGPADISVGYNKTNYLQLATQGNYTVYGIGGTLKFGAFKPMFQYVKHKIDINNGAVSDPERDDYLIGLVATFGATDLRVSFNNYNIKHPAGNVDDAHQIAIGPVYNLSRRTAVYATVAQMDNKGAGTAFATGRATTTPGGKTLGLDLGIRHSF
jgi:predicted porin